MINSNRSFLSLLFMVLLGVACSSTDSRNDKSTNENPSPEKEQVEQNPDSIKRYIMGQFDPAKDPRFDTIAEKYADRPGMMLREEAYDAFKNMFDAAKEEGITLIIRSAARNFDYQKGIWERKWTGETQVDDKDLSQAIQDPYARAKKILQFSSMPGTSRHHWGTEIDLNSFENDFFKRGEGKRIYQWLSEHAGEYGYCQVYTEKGNHRPYGYEEEKWHWSYLPIAKDLTDRAEELLKNQDIDGFLGAQTSDSLQVVQHYVLGIDPQCR